MSSACSQLPIIAGPIGPSCAPHCLAATTGILSRAHRPGSTVQVAQLQPPSLDAHPANELKHETSPGRKGVLMVFFLLYIL